MYIKKLPLIVIFSFIISSCFSQPENVLKYSKTVLVSDFEKPDTFWKNTITPESVFKIENGEFSLHRLHPKNSSAVLPGWRNELTQFSIKSSMRIVSDNSNQSVGLMFLLTADGKGGMVFEFNNEQQYRIKQLFGKFYNSLTGSKKSEGWENSTYLSKGADFNILDVKVDNGKCEFYINNNFVRAFKVEGYNTGSMGFIIGANSKASVDYFYVYSTPEDSKRADSILYAANAAFGDDPETKYKKLIIENNDLDLKLKIAESDNQKAKEDCENQVKVLNSIFDSLRVENMKNNSLKAKGIGKPGSNDAGSLQIALTDEKNNNRMLIAESKLLKDSLKEFHKLYPNAQLKLNVWGIDPDAIPASAADTIHYYKKGNIGIKEKGNKGKTVNSDKTPVKK